ncbi:terminase small subunit [Jeotgalibacillus soli]|uniref:terminase small subunit n=1 Tax=Jeotgalibacillus soli TaxID=889306 RepID=UPI000AD11ED8|nr:terminase small subunit [Jeotgalibacillus soli]
MKFTDKQQMFIDEYLVDLNATQAAIRAGYSEKTAYSQGQRLLKKVEISARIEELKKTRADRLNLDAYWVLKRLMDISDRSMQAEPVLEWDPVEKMMVETGEYQFDSNGANRSTELIGKHLGMFKDNNNLNVNVGVQIVDDIPDDDDDE